MHQNERIINKLQTNPLKNVSLLKMLNSFHEVMETHLVEHGDQWGIVLLLPATAYAYDHRVYPQADYIVFLDYRLPRYISSFTTTAPSTGEACV